MNIKKKILIVGPFVDFGGREIEVRNIIISLYQKYDLKLISTALMSKKSVAINGLDTPWTTIHKEIYNSNFLLKGISFINKIWNKSNLPSYFLVSNKVSNTFFKIGQRTVPILKKEIDSVDVILFCGTLTSGFLKDIMDYCLELNKPFIIRTTGKIEFIPEEMKILLRQICVVLVHSASNALALKEVTVTNVKIVDQTTLVEKSLLGIPIKKMDILTFGFIGRFSVEKGILELLKTFKSLNSNLIIAGSGPLLPEVMGLLSKNIVCIGEIDTNVIASFYDKIDVLVLPSLEEAGPLVGIEAMAAGKLILSTQVGAMPERLKDTKNDFWFNLEKEKSLEEGVIKIENLDKEEVIAIKMELREKYNRNYSINKICKTYLEIVDGALVPKIKN